MKQLLYFSFSFLLFSCVEKTAENSKYSNYISELTTIHASLDSSYSTFSLIDNDSLQAISNEANKKYKKVKEVYESDTIDSKFEVIMLTTRGAIYKKIKKYLVDYVASDKEYSYSIKQYKTLKKNLIHEKINKKDAFAYTADEKNKMILLNGKIKELNNIASQTFSTYESLFLKLDSIKEFHENN